MGPLEVRGRSKEARGVLAAAGQGPGQCLDLLQPVGDGLPQGVDEPLHQVLSQARVLDPVGLDEALVDAPGGACQGFCVSGLQVGCESVGVCGGELGQGLVPVGGDLSFDESALGFALGWWQSFLLVTFSGSFVLNVADRQPQQLDHRLITGEVAAVLGDLAQLVVQRLDAVGGGGTSHEVGER